MCVYIQSERDMYYTYPIISLSKIGCRNVEETRPTTSLQASDLLPKSRSGVVPMVFSFCFWGSKLGTPDLILHKNLTG